VRSHLATMFAMRPHGRGFVTAPEGSGQPIRGRKDGGRGRDRQRRERDRAGAPSGPVLDLQISEASEVLGVRSDEDQAGDACDGCDLSVDERYWASQFFEPSPF
jgi:hypothetical protein